MRIFRRVAQMFDFQNDVAEGEFLTKQGGLLVGAAGGGGGLTFPQVLAALAAIGVVIDPVTGNVVLPEGETGAAALKILGAGYSDPNDLASQSQIYVDAPNRDWAVMTLKDSQAEGVAGRGVLEFGSAGGGTNAPGRLNNTGGVYFSSVLDAEVVMEMDTAETGGWTAGPSTAPLIKFGNRFQVGPRGQVLVTPDDTAVVPITSAANGAGAVFDIAGKPAAPTTLNELVDAIQTLGLTG